ncbi:right-handed parallel beta-helix repeat-containing protein [Mangrovimonas futianensis]|uniref:right-handed parallel beta-helix repeat-containing protein n=1 Tax=Mangrovimonas futianensis TaxID=2895523 RepID=UPI001E4FBEFA|nr:right-handed parallel beta-helix repeat-containing protein [Mangrovimonas futianensis]MCF1422870.1 right-handed parallel beta-helix repeat-containing protein [Mangrovimonas futianensis]
MISPKKNHSSTRAWLTQQLVSSYRTTVKFGIIMLVPMFFGCTSETEDLVEQGLETEEVLAENQEDVSESSEDTPAVTNTFFISPTGNDANDGLSPETAWKTSERASEEHVNPGFSIMFQGGATYGVLTLDSNDGGDPNNKIMVSSYGSGTATLQGVDVINTSGLELIGFNVAVPSVAPGEFPRNGINLLNDLQGNTKLEDISLANLNVSGAYTGIQIEGVNDTSGFSEVLITDCTVFDCMESGIQSKGFFSQSKVGYSHENIHVSDCHVYNISGWDNAWSHSGNGIVLSDVQYSSISSSEVHDSGYDNTHCGGNCGIWYWDAKDVLIEHNEVYNIMSQGCDGAAFDLDGGVVNGTMQYNYSHDNFGAGFQVGQFEGARDMSNIMVRYNISDNDANGYSGSLFIFNMASPNSISGIYFFNNTVIQNENLAFMSYNNWNQNVVQVKNNILYGGIDAHNKIQFEGNSYENPNLFNYQLDSNSPLIDAGVNLDLDVNVQDYFGNPHLVGSSQDIGAHEFPETL